VDSSNCSDAEKEAITVLSAVYAICYLTGGSAVGLSFSVGDQNVSVLDKASPLTVLQVELECILNKEEYEAVVNAADIIKLVRMLRIVGFLTQTKVYLFWKKGQHCTQFY
jgi:hypothetical protein